MNRRGFLGSVFGMVASAPFLFKTINEPIQRVKLPYNAFVREINSRLWVQAPAIEKVLKIENGYQFKVEDLHITHACSYDAIMMQNIKGDVIFENHYAPVNVCNGDTLKLHYSMTASIPLLLEELVEIKLIKMRGGTHWRGKLI